MNYLEEMARLAQAHSAWGAAALTQELRALQPQDALQEHALHLLAAVVERAGPTVLPVAIYELAGFITSRGESTIGEPASVLTLEERSNLLAALERSEADQHARLAAWLQVVGDAAGKILGALLRAVV